MPVLDWIGKDKVVNHHLDVPYHVLDRKYSFDESGMHEEDNRSGNMIIHGDNLLALKSLLPQYENGIDCIYIDPPYNTARSSEKNKAWVYSDNVDDPRIQNWINATVGDEGEDLSRHDKWLCMMYPRLKLLSRLMSKNGVIFISIDDNEAANLRYICDEIFGHHNFIAQLVWRSDGNFDNQAKIKVCHEYILCYTKTPNAIGLPNGIDPNASDDSKIFNDEIRNTVVKNGPKNPMSVVKLPIGFPCAVQELTVPERYDAFPYYHSTAVIHSGKLSNEVDVESGWSSKKILLSFIENSFKPVLDSKGQLTTFEITKTGAIEMIKKRENVSHVLSVLSNLGSTQNMSNELAKMGIKFDFPKPLELIKYLLGFYCKSDSVVLDSFAGSGTTAHAVLDMYKENHGVNVPTFILVEMMDYADTLTAERVKKVICGYGEGKKSVSGTGGSFSYYELGEPLLQDGLLNESVGADKIREYVYFTETKQKLSADTADEPYLLGKYAGNAYYFYYQKDSLTTLDREFLHTVKTKVDGYVMYADLCTLSERELEKYHITFKKIPRDISKL
ncbi:adenine-specific DNA-methyltransferase [Hathewaya proteolytica DSM 3090]|uniref:Adenine-specific DNA-methyltransferase n=1 Tax=Hathewaya proteolytica DSM 3090 TaxID=1121331 RepID=A0A1M6SCY0_9CLOT|nr:site-specific DNA-methyltransferase [Hathewaya proteolytica]SHK42612.1 adenine-specific DNA-methyltransferase [Hathewaya proteolytica DSM 3090]